MHFKAWPVKQQQKTELEISLTINNQIFQDHP